MTHVTRISMIYDKLFVLFLFGKVKIRKWSKRKRGKSLKEKVINKWRGSENTRENGWKRKQRLISIYKDRWESLNGGIWQFPFDWLVNNDLFPMNLMFWLTKRKKANWWFLTCPRLPMHFRFLFDKIFVFRLYYILYFD